MRKLKNIIITLTLLLLSAILYTNIKISHTTKKHIYTDIASTPHYTYAMVFGTPNLSRSGGENHFFTYRMEAVMELYSAQKIDTLILSGDHQGEEYSEIREMKQYLVNKGIPESIIKTDPEGFDTYQSVKNVSEMAGGQPFLMISQKFQLRRALFIAQHHGIYSQGFATKNVTKYFGFLTSVREHFARLTMWKDLYYND